MASEQLCVCSRKMFFAHKVKLWCKMSYLYVRRVHVEHVVKIGLTNNHLIGQMAIIVQITIMI